MYCNNYSKQSLRVDNDRRSRRQSDDIDKKPKRQSLRKKRSDESLKTTRFKTKSAPQQSQPYVNRRSGNGPLHVSQNFDAPEDEISKPLIADTPERTGSSFLRNYYSISSGTTGQFGNEPMFQEFGNPSYSSNFSTPSPSSRKPKSPRTEGMGLKKSPQSVQTEGLRRRPRLEIQEEKKEDGSEFLSPTAHQLDNSAWILKTPSPGHRQETVSRTSVTNDQKREVVFSSYENDLSSVAASDHRLRSELMKSSSLLNAERSKNLTLSLRLQNAERQLKAIEGSQMTLGDSRRIQKLEEEVSHYRREFHAEKKKRLQSEHELKKARKENQRYSEQMDVLIFEFIPGTAQKFKAIGSVDYTVEESFNYVGSYRLGETLGQGCYGSVRSGTSRNTYGKFAIKILKKNNINRFKDLKQIATEIHVLKTYRHPNIIHLEEVIHASENIYMVTERCSMDLHKYYSETGLSLESARQVVFGIVYPLQHLHQHGICHLDLKPENILLTESLGSHNATYRHVRLCDFGLVDMARKSDKSKDVIREGLVVGTPGFYAPEMILTEIFEGRSADMWSLGCIILEITLGMTKDWIDSYDQVDDNRAAFKRRLEYCLSELTIQQYPGYDDLLDLIHSCLSIDPSRRITSERALKHAWLKRVEFIPPNFNNACGENYFYEPKMPENILYHC